MEEAIRHFQEALQHFKIACKAQKAGCLYLAEGQLQRSRNLVDLAFAEVEWTVEEILKQEG